MNELAGLGESGPSVATRSLSWSEYVRRTFLLVGLITAVVLFLALLWYSAEVLMLIFAGALLAVLLRAISGWIHAHSNLSENWALILLLAMMVAGCVLVVRLLLPSLIDQFTEISRQLPVAFAEVQNYMHQYPAGRWALDQMPPGPEQLVSQRSNLFSRITGIFSAVAGVTVNIAIVLATGIYFALNPKLYYEGVVKLFPKGRHQRAREVLDTIGYTLRRWLVGRLAVMTLNGILTGLGLWMLGVPLAAALGLITAFLNFIPNIGPFLAAVPAVLIALAQGPYVALNVLILYLVIQIAEGFAITPLVQQKAVELPPVLVIGAQLLLGILSGFLGILLAVPIVAVAFVVVRMLYVEDLLGNNVAVKGERRAVETYNR